MALEIKISSQQTKTAFFVSDATGDYNAVSNPTGFGAPNPLRSGTTVITFSVTMPDGTVKALVINTVLVTSSTTVDLATTVNVTSGGPISLVDGVYEIDVTYTVSGVDYTYTLYVLRTYNLQCALGKLALSDLTRTEYAELKLEYDRMYQAFECGDYVLANEIMADINDMLVDCNGTGTLNCGCGC